MIFLKAEKQYRITGMVYRGLSSQLPNDISLCHKEE